MVHSPTDDLFDSQQWEHWAMLFILVLGLVVGYGQAAAEDRRRARRRQGLSPQAPQSRRRSRRRSKPREMETIAPSLQPLAQQGRPIASSPNGTDRVPPRPVGRTAVMPPQRNRPN